MHVAAHLACLLAWSLLDVFALTACCACSACSTLLLCIRMYVHSRALLLKPTPHLHVHVAAYSTCFLACSALQAHLFAPHDQFACAKCVRLFMYLFASLALLARFAKLALIALLRCWLLHVHDPKLLLHDMKHPYCTYFKLLLSNLHIEQICLQPNQTRMKYGSLNATHYEICIQASRHGTVSHNHTKPTTPF